MKTKLPLFLRRALLALMLSSTIASVSSSNASDIISINFGGSDANFLNDTQYGITGITAAGSTWNKLTGNSQSDISLINNSGAQSGTINVTAAQGPWTGPSNNVNKPNTAILNGYMDLSSGNQYTISISTDFLKSEVYMIFSGDGASGAYSSMNVNGTNYTAVNGETVEGSGTWGTRTGNIDTIEEACGSSLLKEGFNYLQVSANTGNFTIQNNLNSNRGTIAGIQIVNTYEGTITTYDLSAQNSVTWTSTQLGDVAWTNSTADSGQTAAITAAADGTTITLDSASGNIVLDALWLKSGSLTLVGTGLQFINDSMTRVDAGATLAIGNSMSLGGLNGTGTINIDNHALTIVGSDVNSFNGTLLGSGQVIIGNGVNQNFALAQAFAGSFVVNGGTLGINNSSTTNIAQATTNISGTGGNINLVGRGPNGEEMKEMPLF